MQIGDQIPKFSKEALMPDGSHRLLSEKDCVGGKVTVFLFYPLNFTFVCPTELKGLHEAEQNFKGGDINVLAVSVDSVFCHSEYFSKAGGGIGRVAYPVISDLNHSLSKDCGFYTEKGHSTRSYFICDGQGQVQVIGMHAEPIGRSIDEIFRQAMAIKHVGATGHGCPANWRTGKPDIVLPPPT